MSGELFKTKALQITHCMAKKQIPSQNSLLRGSVRVLALFSLYWYSYDHPYIQQEECYKDAYTYTEKKGISEY